MNRRDFFKLGGAALLSGTLLPKITSHFAGPVKGSLTVSHEYTPLLNRLEWNEKDAFHKKITFADISENSWEARMGKGSQIYSLKNPILGELIGAQQANGPFMDRVIMSVLVDANQTKTNPYFIHQAGTYINDGLTNPYWSPMVYENGLETMVIGQQARLPSSHRAKYIIQQNIKSCGDGVIEIEQLYHNFTKDDRINFMNVPWMGLSKNNVPVHIVSKPDGSYYQLQKNWPASPMIDADLTGGWFALTQSKSPYAMGIGFVFGKDKYFSDGYWRKKGDLRYGSDFNADLTVVTYRNRPIAFGPGESYYTKFFLIINTLEKIQEYGNWLSDKVEYGPATLDPSPRPLDLPQEFTLRVSQPLGNSLYKYPVAGTVPLLMLRHIPDSQAIITDDPYFFSDKMYDGTTQYLGLLGWA